MSCVLNIVELSIIMGESTYYITLNRGKGVGSLLCALGYMEGGGIVSANVI